MLAAHDNARSPLRGDDRHVIPIAVNVDIDNLFSYQRPTIAASNHIDLSSENALKPFHHGNIPFPLCGCLRTEYCRALQRLGFFAGSVIFTIS